MYRAISKTIFFSMAPSLFICLCVCVQFVGWALGSSSSTLQRDGGKGLRLARLCWKTTKKLNPHLGSVPDISSGYWFAISTKDSCTEAWNCVYIHLLSKTGGNWDQNTGLSLRSNFKWINQARESNGQEMAATESVLHFGHVSRASSHHGNVTVVWTQKKLLAISAYLVAKLLSGSRMEIQMH